MRVYQVRILRSNRVVAINLPYALARELKDKANPQVLKVERMNETKK